MDITERFQYHEAIDEICQLDWGSLTSQDMTAVAWAYYYFSVQFRENLKIARGLYPYDEKLKALEWEECDTDNLSPWPGVAAVGERMNHDEYMRRALEMQRVDPLRLRHLVSAGERYLDDVRRLDNVSRALSITSYEDGGLEKVFRTMLEFGRWDNAVLRAFRHFLSEHLRFDSDPDLDHGALRRHLKADDRVLPLWMAFKDILVTCVPRLSARPGSNAGHSERDAAIGQQGDYSAIV